MNSVRDRQPVSYALGKSSRARKQVADGPGKSSGGRKEDAYDPGKSCGARKQLPHAPRKSSRARVKPARASRDCRSEVWTPVSPEGREKISTTEFSELGLRSSVYYLFALKGDGGMDFTSLRTSLKSVIGLSSPVKVHFSGNP